MSNSTPTYELLLGQQRNAWLARLCARMNLLVAAELTTGCLTGLLSAQNSPGSSPRAVIGSLKVVVLKSSGALFEDGSKHRIKLSVGHATHTTQLRKHPLGASKKPVAWDEEFVFDIGLPTDFLAVTCARGSSSSSKSASTPSKPDIQVGALTIALAHLPQATEVTKWYELKSGGQSVAVLQLRLCYSLTYSIHRRDATSSLTIVPSQPAREFLRRELLRYARTSKITYRFIDYFLVLGVDAPFSNQPRASMVQPRILERYPLLDRHDFPIPEQLESFCFPSGWKVEWKERKPICFSFRLNNQTELHTDQTVAAVLCFWEKTIVTRSEAERDDSMSHSPEEQMMNREPSRSMSSRGEDEIEPTTSSASIPTVAATSRNGHLRRPSSNIRTSLAAPEFQSASPLTPSYRVMPAASSYEHGHSPQPDKKLLLQPPALANQRVSPSPEPASIHQEASPNLTHEAASSLMPEDDLITVFVPKCFVFLSRLSFVPILKDILCQLHQHFASRPEEATAQMAEFMRESGKDDTPHAVCPICIDPMLDPKQCSVAVAAVAHHNASIAAHHEQQRLNFANNMEKTPAAAPSAPSSAPSQPPKAASPSTLPVPASAPVTTSPTPKTVHRMDISGMSSNAVKSTPSIAGHQPDISAFGSHAIPPTPVLSNSPRILSPLPEVAPPVLGLTVVTEPQTPKIDLKTPATTVAPTASVPPPTPFAPYTQMSPSSLSSPPLLCNPSCCTCSCCTIRVDCRGLTFEQYIIYLVDEIPLPLPGATSVEVLVCCKRYLLRLPASELDFPQLEFRLNSMNLHSPLRHISFDTNPYTALPQSQLGLLQVLDLEVVLLILRCVLSEMKMIFHSSSVSLLHSVTESLLLLCFPFQWSHIYIPLLPSSLYGMLEAPVSFLVGIESSGLPRVEEMLGVAHGRNVSQANQNAELESRHSRAGAVDSPEQHSSSHRRSQGDSSNPDSHREAPIHDLSNFAFIDIDRGMVDVAVPPPPFPPTAQRSLIMSIRALTRPEVFGADEVRERTMEDRQEERRERIRRQEELDAIPAHVGASYHMHYHPEGTQQPPSGGASLPPLHSPLMLARTIPVDAAQSSPESAVSPSPPTSAQLLDSASPDPMSASPCHAKQSNSFLTSTLPSLPDSISSFSSVDSLHSSQARLHDRILRIEFLQFLASLIANYRDYLFFVSGATPVFDTPSFLSLKGRSESLPFLSRFLETQVFRDFLDRHVEFPSYLQDYLLYINSHSDGCDEMMGQAEEQGRTRVLKVYQLISQMPKRVCRHHQQNRAYTLFHFRLCSMHQR